MPVHLKVPIRDRPPGRSPAAVRGGGQTSRRRPRAWPRWCARAWPPSRARARPWGW